MIPGPGLCWLRKYLLPIQFTNGISQILVISWKQALINSDQTNACRSPQHSKSISHRHGKVKTSKVTHPVTRSSQFAFLMQLGRELKSRKRGKHKKRRLKMKDIFHFHLRDSTALFVTVSVPDQLQTSPFPTTSLKVIYANFKFSYNGI